MRSLSIDIPKFLTDFDGKMLLSNSRTGKFGIFFQIPTRREPDQLSLLTVELEAIGLHPRCDFIYTLRHSHLQLFCAFIIALAISLSVVSILMKSQLVFHNYSFKVLSVSRKQKWS